MAPDTPDDPLFVQCYDELRAMAARIRRGQGPDSIEPTSLLHQAWLRLPRQGDWRSEAHFMATAARAMRFILADRAREERAQKRGAGWLQVTLSRLSDRSGVVDLLVLDESLDRLQTFDPRGADIVVLRCLGGLKHEEIAAALGVSRRTVEREWRAARAWLRVQLSDT